ncbi:hypothetical protein K461DRAFT_226782 [Myriangium duriaei CBS 260.36]|uniref:Kelch repeat protein n=1 Tax=Myriangium duriaei CBS 260.36 TaxID=1168546 RepID=A0A9P4J0Z4_9PEZI|nr:hypothetical protein K461DRAFT_226782 [Myriangium duriaei CBS 260.36]
MYRLSVTGLVLAILIPLLQGTPWFGSTSTPLAGVQSVPVRGEPGPILDVDLDKRQSTSPTDVRFRWSQMSALVNGTLYLYGGQASANQETVENSWNNNFLKLDLTTNWSIASAPLVGLPQPSGPPVVSQGALWHSYDSLYQYGGMFSSNPAQDPAPVSLWEYQLANSKWVQHQNPTTSAGTSATDAGVAVGRAAEGAWTSVPALGRAWYFGGHQDGYTTPGWSQSIARIYLTSLLEYTFPGSTNDQVTSLQNGQVAGSDGVWRNVTDGGVQNTHGFPERADGLLLYIPGYGSEGILIGLAGGSNDTFQQMSQLDIYDIASSTWYEQATSGPTPQIRVDPCAVVASAPDGSTQNVYMFGGQSLQPAGNQTQYNDMWILTIPSFTWIQVDQSSQSVPYARAGHSCNIWNAQMVVVGGYVSPTLSSDSPGVFVFDLSKLKWTTTYNSLSGEGASIQENPLNQQLAQREAVGTKAGLEGSYGYTVPDVVVSVVGGNGQGGATVTAPAQIPTDGPMKTGKPITYTATATSTANPTSGAGSGSGSSSDSSHSSSGKSVGAIVAGVVAGVLAIIVAYLLFCLWLYRRRLALYKRHLDMAQRASWTSAGEEMPFATAYLGVTGHDHAKDMTESSPFNSTAERSSSNEGSRSGTSGNGAPERPPMAGNKSVEDLLSGGEPSFWGTMLSPKRSLRVTNRD